MGPCRRTPELRSALTFLGGVALTVAPLARAEATHVSRQGSTLDVVWNAAELGAWELRDAAGHTCASGGLNQGDNRVSLAKISSPDDLTLVARSASGGVVESLAIPGTVNLSPLQKPDRAVRIYQIPIRTYFARGNGADLTGKIDDLTVERLEEIKNFGVDYIWVTGVLEHASRAQTDPDVVKGEAGSYYAIYDNWDVAAEIGTMDDFERLIDRAHAAGLRILVDFVANHTARFHRTDVACKEQIDFGANDDTSASFWSNNNYYYIPGQFVPPAQPNIAGADGVFDTDVFTPGIQPESPARVTGNNIMSATPQVYDWFETVKLNYGYDIASQSAHYDPRPRTWDQMIDVAKYWTKKGVDGFRVDFAHAVPIEFWRAFAAELKAVQPNVFLLAEAYEADQGMKLPGFSYRAMLDAGFDSIYNSENFWAMGAQAARPGTMRAANPTRMPAMSGDIVSRGYRFTNYMENHDEIRVASRYFAPWVNDRHQRAMLGLAYTAYLGLMPANILIHGGQEFEEDAGVFGPYAGDNGRTSIFDFIYQAQTRSWLTGDRPAAVADVHDHYKTLLNLKALAPFSAIHSVDAPSFIDMDGTNWYKDESKWIASYVRFAAGEAYLVVTNSDPFGGHATTVHFTSQENGDSLGALQALDVENRDDARYRFEEIFSRPGFVPHDPNIDYSGGDGTPGSVLFRPGSVPSGLFLGEIPPATTFVFKITKI